VEVEVGVLIVGEVEVAVDIMMMMGMMGIVGMEGMEGMEEIENLGDKGYRRNSI
jgi:hypothetical protein